MKKITLTKKQLSDLFFNTFKPNYGEAVLVEYEDLDVGQTAVRAGLIKDAQRFAAMIGGQVTAEWLADDFDKRIQEGESWEG